MTIEYFHFSLSGKMMVIDNDYTFSWEVGGVCNRDTLEDEWRWSTIFLLNIRREWIKIQKLECVVSFIYRETKNSLFHRNYTHFVNSMKRSCSFDTDIVGFLCCNTPPPFSWKCAIIVYSPFIMPYRYHLPDIQWQMI